jgi:hypothetical protein
MTDTRWQLAAYVFVSVILWMVAAQLSRRRGELAWLRRLSPGGWPASILRFVYYVGLPYVALILGVVPGRYLGLVSLDRLQPNSADLERLEAGGILVRFLMRVGGDVSQLVWSWLPDVPTILGLGVLLLLLLSLAWLGYGYFKRRLISGAGDSLSLVAGEGKDVGVVYQAIHWSFYRSAVWLLTDDLYVGVVGGILVVIIEWMLEPARTNGLKRALFEESLLQDASILVATSVIFFFVPNLWLLLPVHWMLAMASQRMLNLGQWAVSPQNSRS